LLKVWFVIYIIAVDELE